MANGARVIGREAELAVIAAFIDTRPAGATALVLAGEPGMGKTTLTLEGLARAHVTNVRSLVARPAQGETELPYSGLGDLFAGVGAEDLEKIAPPQRAAVEAALARADSISVDTHALSRGVLELLRRAAAGADLLLCVDDVQWLDRPTASVLTFALRRLRSTPIRILVAMRSESGARTELPFQLGEWEGVRRIDVGPMSPTELGAFLAQHQSENLPRPRVEALHRMSGGNPMLALELARQGHGEDGSGATTLAGAMHARVRALDASARRAASFAAAALRPSIDLLLRAGVGRDELKSALASGTIRANGERLTFAHPLLASAAYELLLLPERREIHALLASATTDAVERGHHVSRSVDDPCDEQAARILDQAAEEAAKLGDHAGAASFLLRAVDLSPDPGGEAVALRQLRAAGHLAWAGDAGAAAALARGLIERLPAGIVRAQSRNLLVNCSIEMSYEEILAELALALEETGDDELAQAEIHLAMAEMSLGMCRLDDAVAHATQANALAERGGAPAVAAAGLALLGSAECMLGRGVTEAARLAFDRWDGSFATDTYSPRMALACGFLYSSTDFRKAEELLVDELRATQEHGLEPVEVVARCLLAEAQLRAGRWAEALRNARDAHEHARQAAHEQIVTGSSYALAMANALLGRHDEARTIASAALTFADGTEDFWSRTYHRAVLGFVALADDDPQASVDVLEPAWALLLERGLGELSTFPVPQVLGEAFFALGRPNDASAVSNTLRTCPVGDRPWCRAMANRLDALVASTRGDHAAARNALEAALAAHQELPEPFELARTLHVAGRIERSARNWGAARSRFVDALERFDQLGAARWAEKAAADLARLPGRRPTDGQGLTERERQIAELVAGGLANKEVATRLFVSLRTVEATLSKVYAKLGVRSRTELANTIQRVPLD